MGDLEVRVCTQDEQGTYVFRCPSCQMSVVKPAERRIVDMLVASGVAARRVARSPPSSSSPVRASPSRHDDLIDFHRLLQRTAGSTLS